MGDDSLDEFLEDTGLSPPTPKAPPKIARSLVSGKLEKVKTRPEVVQTDTTRAITIVEVLRTPDKRIATFELTNSNGDIFSLTIDEATARAISSIFD